MKQVSELPPAIVDLIRTDPIVNACWRLHASGQVSYEEMLEKAVIATVNRAKTAEERLLAFLTSHPAPYSV